MTIDEAKKMVEAKLQCMERDVSGKDDDCNNQRCYECPLNYEQGNMGEQKEWLRMSIEALEQTRWISVSERLPEWDIECIVVDDKGEFGVGFYRDDVGAWDSPSWGWLERKDDVDNHDAYYMPCGIGKVVAWMPLPKPYKKENKT